MLFSHLQALVATTFFVSFPLLSNIVEATHSHLQHHHHARHAHANHGQHEGALHGRDKVGDPVAMDISSVIEQVIYEASQTDPKYNSSKSAQAEFLKAAETIKLALLNPPALKISPQAVSNSSIPTKRGHPHFPRQLLNSTIVANSTLEEARAIVRLAQKEADARNAFRFKNPRLNHYYTDAASDGAMKKRAMEADLLQINTTVSAAAALVAEADALAAGELPSLARDYFKNKTSSLKKRAGAFWMEGVGHTGNWPLGGSGNNGYTVFRNVKDYGVKGDGKTDDTAAINALMKLGGRCGVNCGGSTVKGAILYFPAGTYLISSSITAYYNTQMIGDPNNLPIIMAAPSFTGLGVISSDEYTGLNGGQDQWFINQNNFMRQTRNFIVDLSNADMVNIAGIHWQVAQATSLQNIFFFQSQDAKKSHMGIFAENGSGGWMSDLHFFWGAIGIRCGNQQFTTRNFSFYQSKIAIDLLWDWGWTWKSLTIVGSDIGIQVAGTDAGGSVIVLDSYMSSTGIGIWVNAPMGNTNLVHFSISITNLVLENVPTAFLDGKTGGSLPGGTTTIDLWTQGKVYDTNFPDGVYVAGGAPKPLPPTNGPLMGGPNKGFFERSKPQYETLGAGEFLNANMLLTGNGVTDETIGLQVLLLIAAILNRPVFIPAGSYMITDTVSIPVGSRIVGECWSQIVARGSNFGDMNNPRPMIRIGEVGDSGLLEIQDMLFTTQGSTPGVVLVEWNLQDSTPGSAAMWDSHFRIGGGTGTQLGSADCPKLTGAVNPKCVGGSMLLHMTASSSGYLENVWAWVADHDFDSGVGQVQIDIYVARGILIESRKASWFYGTASEHCILYQYQLLNAKDIYMGMIQTESPYYFPNPIAPIPFTSAVGKFPSDPTFSDCTGSNIHCAAAWGIRILGSDNIHIHGAGLYNWFQAYTQGCLLTQDCQQRVFEIAESGSLFLYNIYTVGTTEMITASGRTPILAEPNSNQQATPWTAMINAWTLTGSDYTGVDDAPGNGPDENAPIDLTGWAPLPSCTGKYSTVEDVIAAKANIPPNCIDQYLVEAEIKLLDDSLNKYTTLLGKGYDDKFSVYEHEVRSLVPQQLKSAMSSASKLGFFTCGVAETKICCRNAAGKLNCTHSGCVCWNTVNCSGPRTEWPAATCPNVGSNTEQALIKTYRYTLVDEAGFFAYLLDTYGIEKSWISFGRYLARIPAGCQGATDALACIEKQGTFWENFPILGTVVIANPKSYLQTNFQNLKDLSSDILSDLKWTKKSLIDTSTGELADSASIPAFLAESAVTSMDAVVKQADEIEAQQRKDTIFNFIMAFLMVLPGVGALLPGLRAVIRLLGNLAEVAMTVADIVESPESAGFAIFEALIGGRSRGSARFQDAAAANRGMTKKDRNGMPEVIRTKLDNIQTLRGKACKK